MSKAGAAQRRDGARQDHEVGKARILDAARGLFEEAGAAGLSMRAIARRVGMPTMTLYGYFPSKTAIIRALWSLAFDPLFAEMRAAEEGVVDPGLRLQRVSEAYVDYWLRNPDRYRMVYLIEDRREQDDGGWFIEQTDVVSSYMRFAALIGAVRGEPDLDCVRDAEALICALTGIAHMVITVSEYPWTSSDRYVQAILKGLL